MKKILFLAVVLFLGVTVAVLRPVPKPLNVVFVTIDSLRPDHLGCYGYKRSTSPNIDSFAREGVVFRQAIAQGSATLASNPSFITGSEPLWHPVDLADKSAYISPATKTLPAVLKERGYTTALFTDHPTGIGRVFGFRKDLDVFTETETGRSHELTLEAIKWLRANRKKKFFLWLYYFGAHGAYIAPASYKDMFLSDGLGPVDKEIPIENGEAGPAFGVIPKYIAEDGIVSTAYYTAKYDAGIRYCDEQIGIFWKGIKKLGLDKNTLFVLVADHGESFGEHGYYFFHGMTLYDEIVKVPLIMKGPKGFPKGKMFETQVRLLDVVPTILDVLGIRKERSMDGVSLKRLILTGSEQGIPLFAFSRSGKMLFSLRTKDHKIIFIDRETQDEEGSVFWQRHKDYYKSDYEFYDLHSDPAESRNVMDEKPGEANALKRMLDHYVQEFKRRGRESKERLPGATLDQETRERLESLGYVS